jgi:NAD(P)-dependent dehydrogenase (short-subunit alcohol dehydrogenase family)
MSDEHRIDILVNNAGLLAKAPVVEAGMDHFRQVMETNFFGCLELIAAVTPQMIQRQSGGWFWAVAALLTVRRVAQPHSNQLPIHTCGAAHRLCLVDSKCISSHLGA